MSVVPGQSSAVIRGAAAVLAALLLLSACSGDDSILEPRLKPDGKPSAPASPSPTATGLPKELTAQQLDWQPCKAPASGAAAPGREWECASLQAPQDYEKPDGKRIGIALIRTEAKNPEQRIGSLLFNFGGPGGSGVSALPNAARNYSALQERYDLVGFDPRGVGGSSAVRCLPNEELDDFFNTDSTPDSPAEEKTYIGASAGFAAACEKNAGPLLPHLTTSNTARDMDLMRQALGDSKLNYFGFSYGTKLGGNYAHLFPKKVGHMAFDAVVDPTAGTTDHVLNQGTGFQRALNSYFKSVGQDPKAGSRRLARLLDRLDTAPLPTDDGRKLTQSLAITGIALPLYSKSNWRLLTRGLAEAEDEGRGSALLRLADAYNNRDFQAQYGIASHAQRSIDCADSSERPTVAEAKAQLPRFRQVSPVFGAFFAWDTTGWCAGWPFEGEAEHPEVSAPGAAPILVVGTTNDSATPYEGAERMVEQLGEDVGILLTNKGDGHGAYGPDNACVRRTVNAFLLQGKAPRSGTTCP